MILGDHFVYIAIAKTGTTSLEAVLSRSGAAGPRKHIPLRKLAEVMRAELGEAFEARWSGLFKFTFVRNPWSRLFSLYSFHQKPKYRDPKRAFGHLHSGGWSFDDWLLQPESPFYAPTASGRDAATPQTFYLSDAGDRPAVDFIGKTESMQEDFDALCRYLGLPQAALPRKNRASGADYRTAYSAKAIDRVGEMMAVDIENFGYTFDGHTTPGLAMVRRLPPQGVDIAALSAVETNCQTFLQHFARLGAGPLPRTGPVWYDFAMWRGDRPCQ